MVYLVNLDQRKEFAQKKGDVIHCEATHVCYVEDAMEVNLRNTNVTREQG